MRRMRRLVTTALLLLAAAAMTAPSARAQGRVIDVEHADSLVGGMVGDQRVRELIGNVRFRQDRIRVQCDRAMQFLESGRVELTGNVRVADDTVTLTAPRGVYHRDGRRAEAFEEVELDDGRTRIAARYGQYFFDGNIAAFRTDVVARDSASILFADTLTYFRNGRRSVAEGNVVIESHADRITIGGGRFENTADPPYSRMTGDPVLVQMDADATGRPETLVVRSTVMESFRDSVRRLVATDSVEIVRASLAAIAGRAVFFTEGDSIQLRSAPVVWYAGTQIAGDSISVFLDRRLLRRVLVTGDARAVSQVAPGQGARLDQMTGGMMELFFADRLLERIEVTERAVSLYHLFDDSAANGANRASGDRLVVTFRGRTVDAITVSGGVEGRYIPENLLAGREQDFSLPGLSWIEGRPRAGAEDFRRIRRLR